jgi:hypothetical protein
MPPARLSGGLFLAVMTVTVAQLRECLGTASPESDEKLSEMLDALYGLTNLTFDLAQAKALKSNISPPDA